VWRKNAEKKVRFAVVVAVGSRDWQSGGMMTRNKNVFATSCSFFCSPFVFSFRLITGVLLSSRPAIFSSFLPVLPSLAHSFALFFLSFLPCFLPSFFFFPSPFPLFLPFPPLFPPRVSAVLYPGLFCGLAGIEQGLITSNFRNPNLDDFFFAHQIPPFVASPVSSGR